MLDVVESQLSSDDLALFNHRMRQKEVVVGDPVYNSWYELKVGHTKLIEEVEEEDMRTSLERGNKSEAMKTMIR